MLPIARPCAASFAAMPGDATKRFCASCNKHVHDLSSGTEADARALFEKNRGERVCVRFAKDSAGNVRFRGAAVGAALAVAACGSNPHDAAAPNRSMNETPKTEALANDDHDMGDGIPDVNDRCPDEPEGQMDDTDGCPEPANAIDAGK